MRHLSAFLCLGTQTLLQHCPSGHFQHEVTNKKHKDTKCGSTKYTEKRPLLYTMRVETRGHISALVHLSWEGAHWSTQIPCTPPPRPTYLRTTMKSPRVLLWWLQINFIAWANSQIHTPFIVRTDYILRYCPITPHVCAFSLYSSFFLMILLSFPWGAFLLPQ